VVMNLAILLVELIDNTRDLIGDHQQ